MSGAGARPRRWLTDRADHRRPSSVIDLALNTLTRGPKWNWGHAYLTSAASTVPVLPFRRKRMQPRSRDTRSNEMTWRVHEMTSCTHENRWKLHQIQSRPDEKDRRSGEKDWSSDEKDARSDGIGSPSAEIDARPDEIRAGLGQITARMHVFQPSSDQIHSSSHPASRRAARQCA
jgi:hypothetical protein